MAAVLSAWDRRSDYESFATRRRSSRLDKLISAIGFCRVHRLIGRLKRLRGRRVLVANKQANAERHAVTVTLQNKGFACDPINQSICEDVGVELTAAMGQPNSKFFSPNPRNERALWQCAAKEAGHMGQNCIARGVPMLIIEVFEMINIANNNR